MKRHYCFTSRKQHFFLLFYKTLQTHENVLYIKKNLDQSKLNFNKSCCECPTSQPEVKFAGKLKFDWNVIDVQYMGVSHTVNPQCATWKRNKISVHSQPHPCPHTAQCAHRLRQHRKTECPMCYITNERSNISIHHGLSEQAVNHSEFNVFQSRDHPESTPVKVCFQSRVTVVVGLKVYTVHTIALHW